MVTLTMFNLYHLVNTINYETHKKFPLIKSPLITIKITPPDPKIKFKKKKKGYFLLLNSFF